MKDLTGNGLMLTVISGLFKKQGYFFTKVQIRYLPSLAYTIQIVRPSTISYDREVSLIEIIDY